MILWPPHNLPHKIWTTGSIFIIKLRYYESSGQHELIFVQMDLFGFTGTHLRRQREKHEAPSLTKFTRRGITSCVSKLAFTYSWWQIARAAPRHLCRKQCNWHIGHPRKNTNNAHKAWFHCPLHSGARGSASSIYNIGHANGGCNASYDRHEGNARNPAVPNNKHRVAIGK